MFREAGKRLGLDYNRMQTFCCSSELLLMSLCRFRAPCKPVRDAVVPQRHDSATNESGEQYISNIAIHEQRRGVVWLYNLIDCQDCAVGGGAIVPTRLHMGSYGVWLNGLAVTASSTLCTYQGPRPPLSVSGTPKMVSAPNLSPCDCQ